MYELARRHQGVRRRRPRDPRRRRRVAALSMPASSSSSKARAVRASRRCCSYSARSTAPAPARCMFEGNDLAMLPDRKLAELRLHTFGFVFQQFNLVPTLSAAENVETALAPLGGSKRQRKERALRLLERRRPGRPRRPPAAPALRWRTAARRHRACAVEGPAGDPRRRTDRQPRHPYRPGDHGDPAPACRRDRPDRGPDHPRP